MICSEKFALAERMVPGLAYWCPAKGEGPTGQALRPDAEAWKCDGAGVQCWLAPGAERSSGRAVLELVERTVVACFLRHGGKICLLKRSQAVESAQGRWHCVSGFVEPGVGPLEQALVEISEETGLAGEAITLVCSPNPIRIERPAQGWVWVIHPFLFDSTTGDLNLDWEHDEYRWIEPTEIAVSDCVPWLGMVWSAVSAMGDG